MKIKGTLNVESGESSINGNLLAIDGEEDPFGAATDFLANRDLFDNDPAEITGEEGEVGTREVIFMTDAVPLAEEVKAGSPRASAVSGEKSALKAGTKKSVKKTSKKSAKKPGAKKTAKKAPAKKSTKKTTRKTTAGKSTKKARRKK